jgi:predicted transcriptional regulator
MAVAKGDADLEKILGPLEADVMRAMWAAKEPLTVRELLDALNRRRAQPLAYTTVMTVMSRLAGKGILHQHREGRSYRYEPAVDDAAGIAVRNVIRDFGDAAVAHFVDEARENPDLLRRLERLIDQEP